VSAVVGQLPQNLQVHPAKRARPGPVAGHDGIELARGWERQLDTRYAAIFYRPTLTRAAYRAWLTENKVRYVALPDAPLDKAGAMEGALIARGLPYLRELWHSEHWRVYRFIG